MHLCVMFVMRSATQPKMTVGAVLWKYNLQYQYIFIAYKMYEKSQQREDKKHD